MVLRRFTRRTDVAENVLGMSRELMSSFVTFDIRIGTIFCFVLPACDSTILLDISAACIRRVELLVV